MAVNVNQALILLGETYLNLRLAEDELETVKAQNAALTSQLQTLATTAQPEEREQDHASTGTAV